MKIDLEIGMRSICPTAADFQNAQNADPTLGTADDQIVRMVVAATTIGSPIVRCVQGTHADRPTRHEKHNAQTVKVVKRNPSRQVDSGAHGGEVRSGAGGRAGAGVRAGL